MRVCVHETEAVHLQQTEAVILEECLGATEKLRELHPKVIHRDWTWFKAKARHGGCLEGGRAVNSVGHEFQEGDGGAGASQGVLADSRAARLRFRTGTAWSVLPGWWSSSQLRSLFISSSAVPLPPTLTLPPNSPLLSAGGESLQCCRVLEWL